MTSILKSASTSYVNITYSSCLHIIVCQHHLEHMFALFLGVFPQRKQKERMVLRVSGT